MTDRGKFIALGVSFFVGVVAAFGLYMKNKPTDEQRMQTRIDRSIGTELCARMNTDLARFKESPHVFKRTALRVLVGESQQAAKALLQDIPEGYPIRFRGRPEALFDRCKTEARQWVRITPVFPEYVEAEKELVGVNEKQASAGPSILPGIPSVRPTKEKRLALVIGNSAYESKPLKNPTNDAADIAKFLRTTGFDVIEILDADFSALRSAIQRFEKDYPSYDVGLIYYSGHGIEFRGRNYLVPINASIQMEEEIPRLAMDVSETLDRLTRIKAGTMILIVDACRNAPIFSKFRSAKAGLETMEAPGGTIIGFSAGPGQLAADGNGRNSPYTEALLRVANAPNKKIEDVFKETARAVSEASAGRQQPWYNSSLIGDFYFVGDVTPKPVTSSAR
jgi:hypothetical protein